MKLQWGDGYLVAPRQVPIFKGGAEAYRLFFFLEAQQFVDGFLQAFDTSLVDHKRVGIGRCGGRDFVCLRVFGDVNGDRVFSLVVLEGNGPGDGLEPLLAESSRYPSQFMRATLPSSWSTVPLSTVWFSASCHSVFGASFFLSVFSSVGSGAVSFFAN